MGTCFSGGVLDQDLVICFVVLGHPHCAVLVWPIRQSTYFFISSSDCLCLYNDRWYADRNRTGPHHCPRTGLHRRPSPTLLRPTLRSSSRPDRHRRLHLRPTQNSRSSHARFPSTLNRGLRHDPNDYKQSCQVRCIIPHGWRALSFGPTGTGMVIEQLHESLYSSYGYWTSARYSQLRR